jgi:hypothetical protein
VRLQQVHIGCGLDKKVIDSVIILHYSYCPLLPVGSFCTSPDWLGQADPVGEEEVLADMRC